MTPTTKPWDLIQAPESFSTISVAANRHNGSDVTWDFSAYFATRDEAETVAATFPKGIKVRTTTLSTQGSLLGSVALSIRLLSNGSTGEKNEAGLRRLAQMLKAIEAKGLEIDWRTGFSNSIASFEEAQEVSR